jgi:hypothetical protein
MIYVGFLSPDIDRLCSFYQNLFGLTEFADARTKLFRRLRIEFLAFHLFLTGSMLGLRLKAVGDGRKPRTRQASRSGFIALARRSLGVASSARVELISS